MHINNTFHIILDEHIIARDGGIHALKFIGKDNRILIASFWFCPLPFNWNNILSITDTISWRDFSANWFYLKQNHTITP